MQRQETRREAGFLLRIGLWLTELRIRQNGYANWMAGQLERKEKGLWANTIGTDGVHVLGELVTKKVKILPAGIQRSMRLKMWNALHARFNVARTELIPVDQLDTAANFLVAYVFEGLIEAKPVKAMKPVVWTRPRAIASSDGPGMPRNDLAIKKILEELMEWGHENIEDNRVLDSFHGAVKDIIDLQVTCWTHIDEALGSINRGLFLLHRWQGRNGRTGNVG